MCIIDGHYILVHLFIRADNLCVSSDDNLVIVTDELPILDERIYSQIKLSIIYNSISEINVAIRLLH